MKQLATRAQRGFSVLAVVLSIVFGCVFGVLGYAAVSSTLGDAAYAVDPGEWAAQQGNVEVLKPPPYSVRSLLIFVALAAIVTVLTGFVAGWIGRDAPIFHAIVTGLLLVIAGLVLRPAPGSDSFPFWFTSTVLFSIVPLMVVGGWLACED